MRHLRIAAEKCRFLSGGRVTDDTSILTLKGLVFEPLVTWREGGTVGPGLFGTWKVSEGGRRWAFRIREGAVFHDGAPCTAEDVIGFIRAILDSVDTFGMRWSYARYMARSRLSARARDTVLVENPEPFADILDVFAEFYPAREDAAGAAVLGTGPYRVAAHAEGMAELERVRGPGPERIGFRAVPGAAARMEAMRSGEADLAMNLERLEGGPGFEEAFEWRRATNTLSVMCYLECRRGMFASPAARLAINHAVDREALIASLFHGLGVPAATVVSPLHLGARAAGVVPIPFDVEAAKRLFDQAGVGGPLVLRTPLEMPEKAPEVMDFVAESLARVGVASRVEAQPDRPEYAREVGRGVIGDVAIFDSSPSSTFRVLDDKISAATRGPWWQGYDDAQAEALFAAARREVEDEAREAAYGACLRRLNAAPPWLYLFHPVEVMAARRGVAEVRLRGTGAVEVVG